MNLGFISPIQNILRCGCFTLFLASLIWPASAVVPARRYSVELSAAVQNSPPSITLNWTADPSATGFEVFRKPFNSGNWNSLGTLPATALSFTDRNVAVGERYEYMVRKTAVGDVAYTGYGFIFAGIQATLVDNRGKVILLVESTYAADLASELNRLEQDLAGDGWEVVRRSVSRNDSVPSVKAVITSAYQADPARTRALFLFGRIPVPYSGNIAPDGHENHRGAWPADVYYGDLDGTWTDSSVFTTNSERRINWNIPGDGKFDQSEIPSGLELEVGRVDLSNLTSFANKIPSRTERDLLRQYLNKNHNFRHRRLAVLRRALVCDNFPDKGTDPVSGSAWRNFSAFFGPANVIEVPKSNYLARVRAETYLWAYGNGGGSYYYADGIADSDDFATYDIKVVFSLLMGSYFGDWDNESNFLRSALASGTHTLVTTYSGFPHSFFHHMALGETVGHGIRISQENQGVYPVVNRGSHQVHPALLGDPTLRMHPVVPPGALTRSADPQQVVLNWPASTDQNLQGYHVYRSSSARGPFERLTASPLTVRTFSDQPASGTHTYQVRAVKLEESASGTYFNTSQGSFLTTSFTGTGGGTDPTPPTVEFLIPASNIAVTIASARISGTASDNTQVSEVRWQVNNGSSFTANGTTSWEATIALSEGANLVSVQSFDSSGNASTPSTRNIQYNPPSTGTNSSFRLIINGGGRVSPILNPNTLVASRVYTLNATPSPGFIFSNWTGSANSTLPRLRFTNNPPTELVANFVTNPFPRLKGGYLGLVSNQGPAASMSGLISWTVTPVGALSGRLDLGGRVIRFTGKLSPGGAYSNTLRSHIGPLQLNLQLPMGGAEELAQGSISGSNGASNFSAERLVYHSSTNPAPQAGRYTWILRPTGLPPGLATLKVDASGKVRGAMELPDGSQANFSSAMGGSGNLPVYAPLYRNQGMIIGQVDFGSGASPRPIGSAFWMKPVQPGDLLFPQGISTAVQVDGSAYQPPNLQQPLFAFSEGVANFTGGGLPGVLQASVQISQAGRLSIVGANDQRLGLQLVPSTGLVQGQFRHPASSSTARVRGVVHQASEQIEGFFLAPGEPPGAFVVTGP